MSEQIYRQAAVEFEKLPIDQKKQKLLDLIHTFKNAHPIFETLSKDISEYSYSDNQYISIYKIMLKSIYEIEKEWIEVSITKIEQLHEFLMELRTREAEDIKQEGNADERLAKVLSNL